MSHTHWQPPNSVTVRPPEVLQYSTLFAETIRVFNLQGPHQHITLAWHQSKQFRDIAITLLHKVSGYDFSGGHDKNQYKPNKTAVGKGVVCALCYRRSEYKNPPEQTNITWARCSFYKLYICLYYLASLFCVIMLMSHIFLYLMYFVCTIIFQGSGQGHIRMYMLYLYRVCFDDGMAMVKNQYMEISLYPSFSYEHFTSWYIERRFDFLRCKSP